MPRARGRPRRVPPPPLVSDHVSDVHAGSNAAHPGNQGVHNEGENEVNQERGASSHTRVAREQVGIGMNAEAIATIVAQVITSLPRDQPSNTNLFPVEKLRKLGAEYFHGALDPEAAHAWIKETERALNVMGVDEGEKVKNIISLLRGKAYDWWESVLRRHPRDTVISWETFKREFDNKYYPDIYKVDKYNEFISLKQEGMSVEEYDEKFTTLSHFAPELVATETLMCKRFEYGLNYDIRGKVTASGYVEYGKLVQAACRVEQARNLEKADMERKREAQRTSSYNPRKKARGEGSSHVHQKATQSQTQGRQAFSSNSAPGGSRREIPSCNICNRRHSGECWKKASRNACFICGQQGHFKNQCPNRTPQMSVASGTGPQRVAPVGRNIVPNQNRSQGTHAASAPAKANANTAQGSRQPGQVGRPSTQARVFAMTQQQAEANPDVIVGEEAIGPTVEQAYAPGGC